MLCMHANADSNIKTYISTGQDEIESSSELKILGFTFGCEPNANVHVKKVIDKMYSKLWTLRYLKKSGLGKSELLSIYKQMITKPKPKQYVRQQGGSD